MDTNKALGKALKQALDEKNFSEFIWKGEKSKEGTKYVQQSERIIDMSEERLQECWNHCQRMLYNDDPKNLGRYNVLEEVLSEINKCNVELFLRYLENSYMRREHYIPTPRYKMMLAIRSFMQNSEKEAEERGITLNWKDISVSHLSGEEIPTEFTDISIYDALDGCIDYLGVFSKQHLTMTFITKMGLWLSKAEEKELERYSTVEKLKTIKEKLHIPEKLNLRFSETGLTYHEMRAMLILPKKQKYSDMTTEQLVTLRNKVLIRLHKEIDVHIRSWKRLKKQIELVAKYKGFKLKLND